MKKPTAFICYKCHCIWTQEKDKKGLYNGKKEPECPKCAERERLARGEKPLS